MQCTVCVTSATGRESDRLIQGVEYRQGQIGLNPESNQWVKYIYETGQCPVVQEKRKEKRKKLVIYLIT